jgi:excisionase family DNA binding protein
MILVPICEAVSVTPHSPHVHFLTIAEAALVSGLEHGTIKRLVEDGRLPSCTIAGDMKKWRRVSRSDVLALRREMEKQLGEQRPPAGRALEAGRATIPARRLKASRQGGGLRGEAATVKVSCNCKCSARARRSS